MNKTIPSVTFVAMVVASAFREKNTFEINSSYHGFKLIDKRFVEEINADCYYFLHEKSGARLLKIAADDPNKLFNIAFKTLPENDYGTPHILEHAVLNGSRNFPVKSPFDVLLKGSLNTFLNAMTSADYTTYPVASMNTKDYFNLMHVYLDAVFNPLMLKDERILKQEGWHYELTDKESPIIYKGVVYNEMKGTFSNPLYQLYYLVGRNLFPDNTYGVSSGGHPDAIPQLTQDYFSDFHNKFYHPSNSYVLLYGDAELNRELEFINKNYLTNYQRSDERFEIPIQEAFSDIKVVNEKYPVPEGSQLVDNTYLCMSFVTNLNTDRATTLAFEVLVNALITNESAPLRLALQEAGIGKEVMGWFIESQQNTLFIIVPNANPEDSERFKKLVFSTLQKVTREGFDKTITEGIINRTEFHLREGDTPQKGLMYLEMMTHGWLFADDPFLGLAYEIPLSEVKKALENRMLETLIEKHLLNNKHALLLTMQPEAGLQSRQDARVEKELAAYKASLSENQLNALITETNELMEYQQREDSPEALATIPMLQLSDIDPDAQFFGTNHHEVAGIPVKHYNEFSNGIMYTSLYFDIRALPQEKIPYAALLSAIIGKLDTENYSYGELDNELNIHTGGFSGNLATFMGNRSDENLLPKMVVSAKATHAKTEKMMELMTEIILRSKYNEKQRLKTLITRHHAVVDANIKQNGMNYAINRTAALYSNRGIFNELTSGVEYYRFITGIAENFDLRFDEIAGNLFDVAKQLFTRKNTIALITCSQEDLPDFLTTFNKVGDQFPMGEGNLNKWNFSFSQMNEAILSASQVQYVVKGYDFKKSGYEWNGKLNVLSQIISTDWLQNQIRVIGGAYGGFCGFSPNGNVYFASFRDPNLKETLDNFDATTTYLEKFEADQQAMTRYIIGTIAGLDQPKTPSQKGSTAMQCFFENITAEMLNSERREILSVTVSDIRQMADLVKDVMSQNKYCVYGNEAKIAENTNLFDNLIRISE
jgi:Zn-dependent M16 (insulinase) family peptidase